MNPTELLRLFAGAAQNTQDFAIEAQLVNASGESVRGIQELIWPRGDTYSPRRAGMLASGSFGCWYGTHPWSSIRRDRHIELHLSQEFSIGIEDLNSIVAAIGDVDVAFGVGCDAVRSIE